MKADINIAKIEWKRDEYKNMPLEVRTNKGESGYGKKITMKTFDLDNPKTTVCRLIENLTLVHGKIRPILSNHQKVTKHRSDKNGFERYGFDNGAVHGVIDSILKKTPEDNQNTVLA